MPWWNDPAAGLTPAVTIDRVAAWFDANGFTYGHSENGSAIVTGFDEYSYVVAVVDGNLMVTHARFWTNLPDDARSLAALRELINRLNQSRTIPSLSTFADEDGRQLAAEIAVPVSEGLNGDQLDDILGTSLQAIISSFEELGEALGIEPTGEGEQ